MVIITGIYVIATIFICRFNWISAKSAQEQTAEMIKQYKENQRPVISVYFDIIRSGLCCLMIENVGLSPAHDVNIKINDKFLENLPRGKENSPLFKLSDAHLFIASGQKFTVYMCGQTDFKNVMDTPIELKVSYDGYVDEHLIDLAQYSYMLIYDSPVEDISQNIKKMKEQEDKFYKEAIKHMPTKEAFTQVIVHNASDDDALKYRIFKYVSSEQNKTAVDVAQYLNIDKDDSLRLLIELKDTDRLIGVYPGKDDDDYSFIWYRR